MKTIIRNLLMAMLLAAASLQVYAQGLLIDQQSWTGPISTFAQDVDGLYLTDQQQGEEFQQTFIPSLSAIDYVALEFESANVPATVKVNVYEGSPSITFQTLLGTSATVTMPSGLQNSGLTGAGVEDFYFSTPISLTPGDDYYFQPVLVSGGAQWAYVTIVTDTYPNGKLYADGSPFVINTDMWFQEGMVAVPEPNTLALIGCAGLFAFMFKRRSKLPVLVSACSLFALSVLPVHATDSVVQATADAAGLTPVSAATLPPTGTFWVTSVNPNGGLATLPYPMLPPNMTDLPTYLITNDIYLLDDTGGKISSSSTEQMTGAEAGSAAQEQSQTVANLIEMIDSPPPPPGATNGETGGTNQFHFNGLPAVSDTTNIWLLATNGAPNLGLLLENAIVGDNY